MTEEDQIRYQIIMHIMCNIELNKKTLSEQLGIDFSTHFKREIEQLQALEADHLLEKSSNGWKITPIGRILIRIIAMKFDAYLLETAPKNLYSKTI